MKEKYIKKIKYGTIIGIALIVLASLLEIIGVVNQRIADFISFPLILILLVLNTLVAYKNNKATGAAFFTSIGILIVIGIFILI